MKVGEFRFGLLSTKMISQFSFAILIDRRPWVKKTMFVAASLLFVAVAMASAIESAEIVSRYGVQAGVLGGYQDADNYIGGMGATFEAEFALGRNFSLSAAAGKTEVTSKWAAVPGATKYNIYWSKNGGVTPANGNKISVKTRAKYGPRSRGEMS